MTNDEKNILKNIRNKRLVFILTAYFSLVYVFFELWGYLFPDYSISKTLFFIHVFKSVPYFFGFLFLLLTIFFINFYLQIVHPYAKDVRAGIKQVIYFTPQKYKTPFFEDYYLETPIKKRSLIKINKAFYELIQNNTTACVYISPHAKFPFSIEIAGKLIKFNELNTFSDL